MITLKSNSKQIIKIDELSITKILDIYPDEHLLGRPFFVNAFAAREMTMSELRAECNKLLMPWQLFFLGAIKLDGELKEIKNKRNAKFDKKLIASRNNMGQGVSLRIADRLIALQEYARHHVPEHNPFPGMLKGVHRDKWAVTILDFFEIDPTRLSSGKKEKTLDYLIDRLEAMNIRVARGVLTNKLLPAANEIRATYRKSSGFVVHDDKVPYLFLPSELNDGETAGRQILTLLSLIILVGLERYNLYVTGDFEATMQGDRTLRQIYGVVSEMLLPYDITDKYQGVTITEEIRDTLASRYMLTPSAVVVTLRQRGLIEDDTNYQTLLETNGAAGGEGKKQAMRSPHLDTSVRKLCGTATSNNINEGIKNKSLTSVQAQYLMFGRVDKAKYETYKANVGL